MYRSIGHLNWALAAFGGGACVLALIALTVLTVFGRYVLHSDIIPGGYNMIEGVIFPLLVFWGLPLAHAQGAFPRLETLSGALPQRLAHFVALIVFIVEAIIYAIVLWYCAKFAWAAIEIGRQVQIGTGYWQAWPIFVMAPLSFALMTLEVLRLMVAEARSLF